MGIPPGLSRIACDEAGRVGLRVFLLDNSGSTNGADGHLFRRERLVQCTRWREICASAEGAATLGAATGVPCEFHLLNPLRVAATTAGDAIEGEDYVRTSTSADVARLIAWLGRVNPRGVTPLAQRLRTLAPRFEAFARAEGASGRVAFLVILTDGAPTPIDSGMATPAAAEAARVGLRRLVHAYPVRLVVRLCTDEDEAISFWNGADAEEELPLDVLDDLEGEAREIAAVGNSWLAYTPALHTLRESGTTIGLLDLLDERALRPGEAATLASLLLDGGDEPLPDWRDEAEGFAAELVARARQAGSGYDARRRRRAPLVDAQALLRVMRPSRLPAGLAEVPMHVYLLIIASVLFWFFTSKNFS